jgi:transposase
VLRLTQAARDLDIHENVLRKWVREFAADRQHAFPGMADEAGAAEIDRLRKEVAKLKAERDILKKAAAYFARSRFEIRLLCETSRDLAGGVDV